MGSRNIGYYFREGFRNIFSHGLMSFAAVCMIVACLLIMGSFTLAAVNAGHMLGDLERDNEFIAYIDDSLSAEEAAAIQVKIKEIPNVDVNGIRFVTREQAMREFKEDKDNQALFQNLPEEVLRHRFEIHVLDIEQMKDTVQQVEAIDGVAKVRAELEIADGFVTLRNVASVLAVVLVVMLVVISLFIIANTIKLATFTRREEIAIMKMCGATNWFIRWPFVFEGILLGTVGAAVAFGLQWGVYSLIRSAVAKAGNLPILSMLPFEAVAGWVGLCFLAAGFLIGACGSVVAIRKFLRV